MLSKLVPFSSRKTSRILLLLGLAALVFVVAAGVFGGEGMAARPWIDGR